MALDFDHILRQPYPRIECSEGEYWLVRSPTQKVKIIAPAYPAARNLQHDALSPEVGLDYQIALYKLSGERSPRTECLIDQMMTAIESGRPFLTGGFYLN